MTENGIDLEIKEFLEGKNDLKYLVALEGGAYNNEMVLFFVDPEKGKYQETHTYTPFLYIKDIQKFSSSFYNGDKKKLEEAKQKNGIKLKALITHKEGEEPLDRMKNGYKYMVESSKSFNAITNFFKYGGIDIYNETYKEYFYRLKPTEQFLIQKGIRMFKGFETYNELHRFTFDLETTSLYPEQGRIFLIGCKDNRGYNKIIEPNIVDDDESEREMIISFFNEINKINPSIIAGYNSENFDFNFLLKRAELLNLDLKTIKTTCSEDKHIYKLKNQQFKVGGETEVYDQTIIYGRNVIDTNHATKRAKAINSEIKETKLKYIAKFSDIALPNRVYVDGNKISKYWIENKYFLINKENNEYVPIPDEFQEEVGLLFNKEYNEHIHNEVLKQFLEENEDKKTFITGKDIIRQYLLDDLYETEEVDTKYNQSSFMLCKNIPTYFHRASTMGGAAPWNLLLTSWSYEKGYAIPSPPVKRKFVGGLSRTFRLGYSFNILKTDYAGLYPSTKLEHGIFPKIDIDGVLPRMLLYFKTSRDILKKRAKDVTISEEERFLADVKQLPLKIFNNSEFGAEGSEFFNWGDYDSSEGTTCRGRQYLRLMTAFFEFYGFKTLVLDTDGQSVSIPDKVYCDFNYKKLETPITVEECIFISSKTGKEHKGLDSFFAKFNEDILNKKYMKVDHDGQWLSCIVFGRKNYANLEYKRDKKTKEIMYDENGKPLPGKLKLVGNSIKSSNFTKFAETFINKSVTMLLENKPREYVNYYYETLSLLYYRKIKLKDIVSKAKVKITANDYIKQNSIPDLVNNLCYKILVKEKDIEKYIKKISKKTIINGYTVPYLKEKLNLIVNHEVFKTENNLPKDVKDYLIKFNEYCVNDDVNGLLEHIKIFYNYKNDRLISNIESYFSISGNKNGKPVSRQAHMELILDNNITINQGDYIYYYNTGTKKLQSDTAINPETHKLYCTYVEDSIMEYHPNTIKDDYNVDKYVDNFNQKAKMFLIVFKEDVVKNLIKTNPEDKQYFSDSQLELTSYTYEDFPDELVDSKKTKEEMFDSMVSYTENEPLFVMSDMEVDYWNKTLGNPYEIFSKFKTNKKLIYKEYFEKLEYVNNKLKEKNMICKAKNEANLQEDDLILIHENEKYYIANYINSEKYEIIKEVLG